MSTRGVYGFRKNGVDKLTYNHEDSFPDTLGLAMVQFCFDTDVAELNEIYDRIIMVDESDLPTAEQFSECEQFADSRIGDPLQNDWYKMLRKAQGKPFLYKNELKYMTEAEDFILDSEFCEYGYIINLDDETLEYWEGDQEKPQKGNRYGTKINLGYYPCALMKSFPLDGITLDAAHQMIELSNNRLR